MKFSLTFSLYILRIFSLWFGAILGVFFSLIFLFESVELLRRTSAKTDIGLSITLKMALLKSPHIIGQLIPLIVLFATLLSLRRLQKSFELVVARSSGFSIGQIVMPLLIGVLLFGCFDLMILNQFNSSTKSRFERMELTYLKERASQLTLSDTGLWLKQEEEDGYTIIRAAYINLQNHTLSNVSLYSFKKPDVFSERLDAAKATMHEGFWELSSVFYYKIHEKPVKFPEKAFKTRFTFEGIEDHFTPPETLSFWELPSFINMLESAGFSGVSHRFHWQTLLVKPFLMIGMVLLAACFSFQWGRARSWGWSMASALGAGFLLYLLNDVMRTLALSLAIPIDIAVWLPIIGIIFLSMAYLLHLENG